MELQELFLRFALALGVGLLIGLERGWTTRADAPGTRTAGIRTFALAGLLGGLFGSLSVRFGEVGSGLVLGLAFAAFAAVFAMFCREENRADKTFSATTMVAGLTTFALGAYALIGDTHLAAAGGVVVAGVLALREGLHRWVARVTQAELRAGLMLLAMTFIALPLLPDRNVGPFGGVNPRHIWLIAIVLAAISFVGYIAVKIAGPKRGILLSAAAGGIVSSTAVTISNARRAAAGEGDARLLAAGAALATAVALLRTLGLIAALNDALLRFTVAPLLAAATTMAGAAYILSSRKRDGSSDESDFGFRNPFEPVSVVLFALLLGAIVMAGQVVSSHFGGAGAIAMALIAGLADTDSVVVAMARLTPDTLATSIAAWAILAAIASNTLSKVALGVAWGGAQFALPTMAANSAAIVTALLAYLAAV